MSRLKSNPIMIKERASMVWLPFGSVEVMDGAFILVDKDGVRIQIGEEPPVQDELGDGNVVMVWPSNNDIGFEFDTCGVNRRIPVDMDGLMLCSFQPAESANSDAVPQGMFSSDDNW